jgi:hypothetical protein
MGGAMEQIDRLTARDGGWVTTRTKDGSQTLQEPFYSTNPLYVAQHKEWDWQECDAALARREVNLSLRINSTNLEKA